MWVFKEEFRYSFKFTWLVSLLTPSVKNIQGEDTIPLGPDSISYLFLQLLELIRKCCMHDLTTYLRPLIFKWKWSSLKSPSTSLQHPHWICKRKSCIIKQKIWLLLPKNLSMDQYKFQNSLLHMFTPSHPRGPWSIKFCSYLFPSIKKTTMTSFKSSILCML